MTTSRGGWARRLPAPTWALASLAALLAVVALAYEELAIWAWAAALLAPVAAVVLLATCPLVSLGVCVLTALATALAMDHAVPPWSAALGAALCVISALAGRRSTRPAPALTVFAVGVVLAVLSALIRDGSVGLVTLVITVMLPWLIGRLCGRGTRRRRQRVPPQVGRSA